MCQWRRCVGPSARTEIGEQSSHRRGVFGCALATVNGRPSFQLVPLEEDDDLIDRLIEHHPGFGGLLERRLRERSVPMNAASRRLAAAVSPNVRRIRRG